MKYSSSARTRVARFLASFSAASLLAGPISSFAARAQTSAPTPAPSVAPQPSAEEAAQREDWRSTIARTPAPKKSCFTASYPKTEWQEVPCGRPSPYPNLARWSPTQRRWRFHRLLCSSVRLDILGGREFRQRHALCNYRAGAGVDPAGLPAADLPSQPSKLHPAEPLRQRWDVVHQAEGDAFCRSSTRNSSGSTRRPQSRSA